jgi:hypothetical protein
MPVRDTFGTGVFWATYEGLKQIMSVQWGLEPDGTVAGAVAGGACGSISYIAVSYYTVRGIAACDLRFAAEIKYTGVSYRHGEVDLPAQLPAHERGGQEVAGAPSHQFLVPVVLSW